MGFRLLGSLGQNRAPGGYPAHVPVWPESGSAAGAVLDDEAGEGPERPGQAEGAAPPRLQPVGRIVSALEQLPGRGADHGTLTNGQLILSERDPEGPDCPCFGSATSSACTGRTIAAP